jgi:parallel beta-helix repeat protein
MNRKNRLLVAMGWCLTASFGTPAAILYVAQNSPNPGSPYDTWSHAAHTIQEAVDAAQANDTILVTNGIYASGGRVAYGAMSNRVAVTKPLTVRSVNGPGLTIIQGQKVPGTIHGDRAVRCVYLTNGAALVGFTLTNGATRNSGDLFFQDSGGGVWGASASAVVSNCVLTGNSASYNGGGAAWLTLNNCLIVGNAAGSFGGGTAYATLNNCVVTSNTAGTEGGGAVYGSLRGCLLTGNRAGNGGGVASASATNCTLAGNSASGQGGGSYYGPLINCIVYYNTASDSPNYVQDDYAFSPIDYSCTLPLPTNGTANLASAPLFLDFPGGNLRLQSNSPCVNTGLNAAAPGSKDLDGRPRIVTSRVDMGAYEYQTNASGLFIAWLGKFGLPTDGSADFTDADEDLMNNCQEWVADTNPTNSASCLRVALLPGSASASITLSSSTARLYTLLRCTLLASPPAASVWDPVPSQIGVPGTGGSITLTDDNPPPTVFYRVSVGFP